jgi:hypothetical protein
MGLDLACMLVLPGSAARPARMLDVAQGGAGLRVAGPHGLAPGMALAVQLPGEDRLAQARVARITDDGIAVVFRQDAETLGAVERLLARLERKAAA